MQQKKQTEGCFPTFESIKTIKHLKNIFQNNNDFFNVNLQHLLPFVDLEHHQNLKMEFSIFP